MASKQTKLRAIDLFAGIGGIRLGFKMAFRRSPLGVSFGNEPEDEIEFVYANEIDKFACETYAANYGDNPYGDLTKVTPEDLPDSGSALILRVVENGRLHTEGTLNIPKGLAVVDIQLVGDLPLGRRL